MTSNRHGRVVAIAAAAVVFGAVAGPAEASFAPMGAAALGFSFNFCLGGGPRRPPPFAQPWQYGPPPYATPWHPGHRWHPGMPFYPPAPGFVPPPYPPPPGPRPGYGY